LTVLEVVAPFLGVTNATVAPVAGVACVSEPVVLPPAPVLSERLLSLPQPAASARIPAAPAHASVLCILMCRCLFPPL
jgi:hypothetical protein